MPQYWVLRLYDIYSEMELEICCQDIDSVLAARDAGVRRIELCSALTEGGLTPSAGLVRAARESGIPSVNVLIRPRSGDFLYTEAEVDVMCCDIRIAFKNGATGVVIGALDADGNVDMTAMRKMCSQVPNAEMVFHRAFDLCADPLKALEEIISLGCRRLLTSGCAPSAMEGREMLSRLVEKSAGRIKIMAGAGVNASNIADIAATGVDAVHASAKTIVPSRMKFRRQDVAMGSPDADEYSRLSASPAEIRELLRKN